MAELARYVEEKQGQLELMRESKDNEQLSCLQTLVAEHQLFKTDLQSRHDEVDEVEKTLKRHLAYQSTLPLLTVMEESAGSSSRLSLTPPSKKLSGSKLKILDRQE